MVFFIAFLISFLGVYVLNKFAYQLNLLAISNERSLHQNATPQGGGVVIGIIFLVFCVFYYLSGDLKTVEFFVLFGGCLIMSITGFLDDIIEIKHQAQNRNIYAQGAIRAAIWSINQKAGFYSMQDVLNL